MAGDQCMEDRGQIDLTSVSLSLHCQMFILFSVTDSGCAPSCVCVRASCPHVALRWTGPD